jgi:hypothetical protein
MLITKPHLVESQGTGPELLPEYMVAEPSMLSPSHFDHDTLGAEGGGLRQQF